MKYLLLIGFIVFFPVFVFLTSIRSLQNTNQVLKSELLRSDIYTKVINQLQSLTNDQEIDEDSEVISAITSIITPSYLRSKVEEAIDQSDLWIRGERSSPPTISVKELEESLMAQYPNVLTELENVSKELENVPTDDVPTMSGDQAPQSEMRELTSFLTNLKKNDFSLSLEKGVAPLKDFYSAISLIQPIILVLLLLGIVVVLFLCSTIRQRGIWVGWMFLLAGVSGIFCLGVATLIASNIETMLSARTEEIVLLATPLVTALSEHVVSTYVTYQLGGSIILFVLGAISFALAEVSGTKKQSLPTKIKVKTTTKQSSQ